MLISDRSIWLAYRGVKVVPADYGQKQIAPVLMIMGVARHTVLGNVTRQNTAEWMIKAIFSSARYCAGLFADSFFSET